MDYLFSEYPLGYGASAYILIQLGRQGYHIIHIHEYLFISLVPPSLVTCCFNQFSIHPFYWAKAQTAGYLTPRYNMAITFLILWVSRAPYSDSNVFWRFLWGVYAVRILYSELHRAREKSICWKKESYNIGEEKFKISCRTFLLDLIVTEYMYEYDSSEVECVVKWNPHTLSLSQHQSNIKHQQKNLIEISSSMLRCYIFLRDRRDRQKETCDFS